MNIACRTALIFSFSVLCSCSLFRTQTPPTEDITPEQQSVPSSDNATIQASAQPENEPSASMTEQTPEPAVIENKPTESTLLDVADNEAVEEEPVAPPPPAPAAELRGLRSPKMPAVLPMSLDGKVQN